MEENLNLNEATMKKRGEEKVWKKIKNKDGEFKKISSTQIGQQILLDESLRILPMLRDWIENKSGKSYRYKIEHLLEDDDKLLKYILSILLLLSGSIYNEGTQNKTQKGRQKKIITIRDKVMPSFDFDIVWRIVEIIIDSSKYFDVEKKFISGKHSFSYISNLSEEILSKLHLEAAKSFFPLPMTKEPLEWIIEDGKSIGGYETFNFDLVRVPGNKEFDYSKLSQKVVDSINYIQRVPWIVNEDILKILEKDLKFPNEKDYLKSTFPKVDGCEWDIDINSEDCKLSKKEIFLIKSQREKFNNEIDLYNGEKRDFQSAIGKYRAVKIALDVAKRYVDKTIYFPHSFDFRGRIYPITIGLHPQGSDAIKALLLYKNKEKVTKRGMEWNWAYLASLYGDDKLPFLHRVERGKELIGANYKDADEPYQFLSHQIELKKHLDNPSYSPNTRIHLDACNSGSQFTSAITRDLNGCIATNVIPSINDDGTQDRKDAYLLVAKKALELSISLSKSEKDYDRLQCIKLIIKLLKDNGRKICKVPVMVSNYGGTNGGRSEILFDLMRELNIDRELLTKKNAYIFSSIIGDSITGVLNGGKAFENYIQKMNNVIAKGDKAITWTTSDGFFVNHVKNKELKAKRVSILLPNSRKPTTMIKKSYSSSVSPSKMRSAISPNYIHSLDAELLRRVVLKMKENNIHDTDWIHDSFGCHPNHVDKLLEITKNEFLELIQRNPLKVLDEELRKQVPNEKKLIKLANEIEIPDFKGFKNIELVIKSNWFFS